MIDNAYIDVREASKTIGCSIETVRNYQRSGKLKVTKSAGKSYFKKTDVETIAATFLSKKNTKTEIKNVEKKDVRVEEIFSETLPEDLQLRRDKRMKLTNILEKSPPKTWVKEMTGEVRSDGRKVLDLPIDKVEYLMNYIFSEWWYEVREVKQILKNSVVVTVRVFYMDMFGEWKMIDGVGASYINIESDVVKEVPKATALAVKNACKRLGKLFGRDLNRDIETTESTKKDKKTAIHYTLMDKVKKCSNFVELDNIREEVMNSEDEEVMLFFNNKEFELS